MINKVKKQVKKRIIHIMQFVQTRPQLSAAALRVLNRLPRLKEQLKRMRNHSHPASQVYTIRDMEILSPRARKIYGSLRASIEQRQKGQL